MSVMLMLAYKMVIDLIFASCMTVHCKNCLLAKLESFKYCQLAMPLYSINSSHFVHPQWYFCLLEILDFYIT